MELGTPEPHETLPKFELNGIRRGHYCRLKTDNGFIWAMVQSFQAGMILGVVESSFPGGPERGSRIAFTKSNVFEIL